ncbi:MAG TPA: hypothetical protein VD713_02510 [Sphingomonadales bacterium]|nr:hypothetical protein [Sphingomonadales bacterium]
MGSFYDLKFGLVASFLFHAAIAIMITTGLPMFQREILIPPRPIPVEIVAIDDVTRVKAPEPEPAPAEEQKFSPAPARAAESTEGAVPPPDAEPLKKPEPKKTEFVREVTPQVKPAPPSKFDSSKIAALIDRSIKETKPKVDPAREMELEQAIQTPAGSLDVRRMTATIQDYVRQKMLSCWSVPAGAEGAQNFQVSMTIRLNPAGYLVGAPVFRNQTSIFSGSNPYFRAFAESTARAVRRCEPYDKLPKETYDLWKELELNFTLSDMLG